MTLIIVPLYAGICAIIYAILTIRTILGRFKHKISIGHGSNPVFERVVRAHGNFSEYTPFILFLLALLELRNMSPYFLHTAGIILVLARVIHAVGITQGKNENVLRPLGMIPTIGLLFVTGVINIYLYVGTLLS